MPYATLRFSCHPGMFLSPCGRFLYRDRLFFIPSPDCRRTAPASARDMPQQTDIPRVFLQPLHIQSRNGPAVYHPAATQHTFERVTTQELLHHLCIAYFRHRPRFIHPQSTVHLRQHTRLARNPKYLTILKNFSGMCCFSLATSSRCVSVSVAVSPVLWSR